MGACNLNVRNRIDAFLVLTVCMRRWYVKVSCVDEHSDLADDLAYDPGPLPFPNQLPCPYDG